VYWEASRHPRAGAAIGAAILAAWVGALGAAFGSGNEQPNGLAAAFAVRVALDGQGGAAPAAAEQTQRMPKRAVDRPRTARSDRRWTPAKPSGSAARRLQ
jgi:hypothetical protein